MSIHVHIKNEDELKEGIKKVATSEEPGEEAEETTEQYPTWLALHPSVYGRYFKTDSLLDAREFYTNCCPLVSTVNVRLDVRESDHDNILLKKWGKKGLHIIPEFKGVTDVTIEYQGRNTWILNANNLDDLTAFVHEYDIDSIVADHTIVS